MSKDKALEDWIEAELPDRPDFPVTSYRIAAREAWHAAVRNTLAYVARELRSKTGAPSGTSVWLSVDDWADLFSE